MTYCANCGENISEEDNFCQKCGVKTVKDIDTNAPTPSDEMRQVLARMSTEIEKAFALVAKQIQEAFQTAEQNIQKQIQKLPVECTGCQEQNLPGSIFCFKCGRKLEPKGKDSRTGPKRDKQ